MIIPDALTKEQTARIAAAHPVKVLFVCLGNICRSPAAQGIMQRIVDEHHDSANWLIDSAGTGDYHIGDLPDRRMRVHALRRGLTLDHICRQVRTTDFYDFDLIIGMDQSNIDNLRRIAPTPEMEQKIAAMARFFGNYSRYDYVPDPYYDGDEGFELVLTILDDACRNLYDTINSLHQSL